MATKRVGGAGRLLIPNKDRLLPQTKDPALKKFIRDYGVDMRAIEAWAQGLTYTSSTPAPPTYFVGYLGSASATTSLDTSPTLTLTHAVGQGQMLVIMSAGGGRITSVSDTKSNVYTVVPPPLPLWRTPLPQFALGEMTTALAVGDRISVHYETTIPSTSWPTFGVVAYRTRTGVLEHPTTYAYSHNWTYTPGTTLTLTSSRANALAITMACGRVTITGLGPTSLRVAAPFHERFVIPQASLHHFLLVGADYSLVHRGSVTATWKATGTTMGSTPGTFARATLALVL